MPWSYVTIDKHGPVAVVRFDRKENLNAFNQQLVRELTEAACTFHDDLETQRDRRRAASCHGVRRRRPEPAHGVLRGGPDRA